MAASVNIAPADRLALFRSMLLIRLAEQRLGVLFADGEIPGFIHLSIGQEAVPAGVSLALEADDTVASNHRGHGHALAKGMDLDRFFLEVMGKADGICQGRGGSMHVADMGIGMLGANGIVGAGLPLALGSALAHQVKKRRHVAVAYFGDGALAEGVLHECLNLAALWKLPLLLVCENNGWSEFSPTARQFVAPITKLAEAFGMTARTIDGNDAEAVHAAARDLVGGVRRGQGPALLECITRRGRGHYEGDPQKYRDDADIAALAEHDPLARLEKRLVEAGTAAAVLDAERARIAERVEAAVNRGRAGRAPDFAAALADVYSGVRP